MQALEFAELSRGRPGSEQFNPQMLTWDAEGWISFNTCRLQMEIKLNMH
jgi:hypothetical protein